MDRRAALLTIAYVALGTASSYALVALLPDGDYSVHERGGGWLVTYLCVGAVASVAFGAAVRRWWALPVPGLIPVATIPAGDVAEYLPLVALVVVCVPFAAAAIGFGWSIARFGIHPNALDAIWCASAALLLAYATAWVAAISAGHNPWEDPEGPDPGVFMGAMLATLGALGALVAAAGFRGPEARERARRAASPSRARPGTPSRPRAR
jgi:hypothetical protein